MSSKPLVAKSFKVEVVFIDPETGEEKKQSTSLEVGRNVSTLTFRGTTYAPHRKIYSTDDIADFGRPVELERTGQYDMSFTVNASGYTDEPVGSSKKTSS